MYALLLSFFAACCASISNLFFRQCTEKITKPDMHGYVVFYYLFSFLFSLIICYEIWTTSPRLPVIIMASCVGVFNIMLMWLTSRALKCGPAGLTFAFQNASAIFPGIFLFIAFGPSFGFAFTYFQLTGVVLVLFGLYLGTKDKSGQTSEYSGKWMRYALGCVIVQIAALTIMQVRCIFIDCDKLYAFPAAFSFSQLEDAWFMPTLFATALLVQIAICVCKKTKPGRAEIFYGSLAGITNAGSTFLLLLATQVTVPGVSAILFPCFAVSTILLCNTWANRFYKEKFNFFSNATCASGVFLGSMTIH